MMTMGFPSGSAVENLPKMQETWVRSLGWHDPLGWDDPQNTGWPVFWPGEFHGLCSPFNCKESDMTERLSLSTVNLKMLILIFAFSL